MPGRILVVEDDAMNAKLFQLILARKAGYQVEVTEDPALVFERARSGMIDLIIMDVSLSNSEWEGKPVDGLEISRRLKRDPVSSKIPILLGADDYISKPIVSADELIQRIQTLIQKRDNAVPPAAR